MIYKCLNVVLYIEKRTKNNIYITDTYIFFLCKLRMKPNNHNCVTIINKCKRQNVQVTCSN